MNSYFVPEIGLVKKKYSSSSIGPLVVTDLYSRKPENERLWEQFIFLFTAYS
jgi:hypothetical protein